MRQRRERIVLLRSGRHHAVAIGALRARWPGCDITVVATPGTRHAVESAGIPAEDCLIYDHRPTFGPRALVASGIAGQIWRRGFDRVAVLWLDPDGRDRGNVNRTALVLSPLGFAAITPDGCVHARPAIVLIAREMGVAAASMALAGALWLLAYMPAAVIATWRRLARAEG